MFGTNFTYDLLVTTQAQTVIEIGEQRVYDGIEQGLAVHNRLTSEVFGLFAEVRNETVPGQFRYETYGANSVLKMRKVDQIGVVDAQKTAAGYTVGFPVDRRQAAIQWTRDYLEYATVAELLRDFNAVKQGDVIEMRNELLTAIFTPTNRTSVERFHNHVSVDVKALVNADGNPIPEGPNGQTFDGSTHTHYLAINGATQTAVKNAIDTVKEHYSAGTLYLFINKAQEATVRGFTDFIPLLLPGIIAGTQNNHLGQSEEILPIDDREIGQLFGCRVWVKPWMPANYWFTLISGGGIGKIARFRQRRGGLYIASKIMSYPLEADIMEHQYGAGVLERTAGSILYSGGGSYVAPTFS